MLALAALVALTGCEEELETSYGHRGGIDGGPSANGTGVLGDLFAAAGHKVESRRALSPRLSEAEIIVWFPDDFAPPSPEVIEWIEQWMSDGYKRTLIYVGRDFDAAPLYWRKIEKLVRADKVAEIKRRQGNAAREFKLMREIKEDSSKCEWFELQHKTEPRDVRTFAGAWAAGVDAAKAEIQLHGRMEPNPWADSLLESGDDVLVSRYLYDTSASQLILVANGSFLLNLPLVNHEHRKLAGHLIAAVGEPSRVAFLESDAGGPKILDHDPVPSMSTGLEILKAWPLGAILLHFAVLGIIFCFARFPIFGTSRQPSVEAASDFGRHVDALGELLERTGDSAYAQARLAQYREGKAAVRP